MATAKWIDGIPVLIDNDVVEWIDGLPHVIIEETEDETDIPVFIHHYQQAGGL